MKTDPNKNLVRLRKLFVLNLNSDIQNTKRVRKQGPIVHVLSMPTELFLCLQYLFVSVTNIVRWFVVIFGNYAADIRFFLAGMLILFECQFPKKIIQHAQDSAFAKIQDDRRDRWVHPRRLWTLFCRLP